MTGGTRFEKLLEPGYIGKVKTRNRIIKSAAGLQYWNFGENPVSDKGKYLYEAFARGGVNNHGGLAGFQF